MSRFNSTAYDKLFPRITDSAPVPETAVETFRPSQYKKEDSVPETVLPDPVKADPVDPDPDGGDEDGYGGDSESDSE